MNLGLLFASPLYGHPGTCPWFGGKALVWMGIPRRRSDGPKPLQMCVTGMGRQLVEEMLIQIEKDRVAS
jgi:hypothetical protein